MKEDITPDAMLAIIDRFLATEVDGESIGAFSVIGIDEIALKKGHRDYVATVTARLSTGDLHVLAVLPDRTKDTLMTWLQTIPTSIRRQVRTVCTSGWEGYVTAVQTVLEWATLVID